MKQKNFVPIIFFVCLFTVLPTGWAEEARLLEWLFEDPAGTELHQAENTVRPQATWSQSLEESTTTGEGTFRIRQRVGGRFSRVNTFHDGSGWLRARLTIAGWDFRGLSGGNPRMEISFMNGLAESMPTQITAEAWIFFDSATQSLQARARAFGTGATEGSTGPLLGPYESRPVELLLSFHQATRQYRIHLREGFFGNWEEVFSGSTGEGRVASSIRLMVTGDFVGDGTAYFDLDGFTLTKEDPFAPDPETVVLNETRTENGSIWDLDGRSLLIGSGFEAEGDLRLENGGRMESFHRLVLGEGSPEAIGKLSVTGGGNVLGSPGGATIAGDRGTGLVVLDHGSLFQPGPLMIGHRAGSSGEVEARQNGSAIIKTGTDLWIGYGQGAEGALSVRDGAVVEGARRVHVGVEGVGLLQIEGGSTFRTERCLHVGSGIGGNGLLEIRGASSVLETGGSLRVASTASTAASGGTGRVEIEEGGSLHVEGTLSIFEGGSLKLGPGSAMVLSGGLVLGAGADLEIAGETHIPGDIAITPGANLHWLGGTLRVGGIVTGLEMIPEGRTLFLTQAGARLSRDYSTPLVLHGNALIVGPGAVFNPVDMGESESSMLRGTGRETRLRMVGPVTGSGLLHFVRVNGDLSPGNGDAGLMRLLDVTFTRGSTLTLHIAGSDQFGAVVFGDLVDFSNVRLRVRFADGFYPSPVQSFDLLRHTGNTAPDFLFATMELPPGWELDQGTLLYTGAYRADTYGKWKRIHNLSGPMAERGEDPDGDGVINLREYLFGGNPLGFGGPLSTLRREEDGFSLSWNRPLGGAGDYIVETSPDLHHWTESDGRMPETVTGTEETSLPRGYETVGIELPATPENAFVRVRATEFPRDLVYPEESWDVITDPAAEGVPPSVINQALAFLQTLDTTGFVAVKGGRILFEYGDTQDLSYVASVRKSILSMLYGKYVAAGEIALTETLGEIGLNDRQGLLEIERQATVHDLLRARSGVYHPPSNTGDDADLAPPRGSQIPGEYYLYNNWDFNALGTILTVKTGKNPYEALMEDLAIPLQMEDFSMEAQSWGGNSSISIHRAYHFTLSTRDMARIGLLMLRDGVWRGERIIPEEWMEESLFHWTPSEDMNPPSRRSGDRAYSYLWWMREAPEESPFHGSFAAHGFRGQYIMVVPKADLVLAHKTNFSGTSRSVSRTRFYELADILVHGMTP